MIFHYVALSLLSMCLALAVRVVASGVIVSSPAHKLVSSLFLLLMPELRARFAMHDRPDCLAGEIFVLDASVSFSAPSSPPCCIYLVALLCCCVVALLPFGLCFVSHPLSSGRTIITVVNPQHLSVII